MTILVEKLAGYRRIRLNRPERLNALTVEMAAALAAALDDTEADKTCRAVLLTGAGRGFCAGQDLTEIVGASPGAISTACSSALQPADPPLRRCRCRSSAPSTASPPAPAPISRSPATSCSRRARRASCRPSPASAWSRIAAAPGFCRASSARPAPARWRCSAEPCRPRPPPNGASSGAGRRRSAAAEAARACRAPRRPGQRRPRR